MESNTPPWMPCHQERISTTCLQCKKEQLLKRDFVVQLRCGNPVSFFFSGFLHGKINLKEIALYKLQLESQNSPDVNTCNSSLITLEGKKASLSMAREKRRITTRLQIEYVPRDILFSILSRLPLKSVLRFCCVSKYWFDAITDPDFRRLHFLQSATDPTVLILLHRKSMENIISMSPLNIKEHRVNVSDNAISHLVISGSCKLVGTCNGLLCFTSSIQGESIFVCNPITRELVTLPKPTRTAPPESSMLIYGFGFDYLTKKYKVVRVFYPTNSRFRSPRFRVTAEVYTLGATSSWKAVQGFNRPPYGHPVFANGAVHWLVHPLLSHKYERIISFDIGKDEFNVTPHPKFSSNISLGELGDCLSVVPDIEYDLVKVWVLKDHTENRWEKQYIFHIYRPYPSTRFPRLISICELNRVLLVWLQDGFNSYERKTKCQNTLKISGFPTWLDWEVCSGYRGSLVPLGAYCGNKNGEKDVAYFVSDINFYSSPACSGL